MKSVGMFFSCGQGKFITSFSASDLANAGESFPIDVLGSSSGGGESSGANVSTCQQSTFASYGSISVIGRQRVMEDTLTIVPGILAGKFEFPYDLFAVYDGHGGSTVSHACRDRMHVLFAKEIDEEWTRGDQIEWENVMATCFKKMDGEVCDGGGGEVVTVGSTAVVVIVGAEVIVVANCGHSRAVLCRAGVAIPLSSDHKPDRPDEKERVEAAIGKVLTWSGSRVQGILATSRSIGDQYMKPYVISEPEVTITERNESDDFIIIASAGLWDVLPNNVACEIVRSCLGGRIKKRFGEEMNGNYSVEAAAMITELAMARGSKDNISVIVIELNSLSQNNP